MKEGSPQAQPAQERKFMDWCSQPENMQAVGRAWSEQWEREHWEKDEPEQPLTPEEQARVDAYYPRVTDTLEARTEDFDGYVVDEATRQRAVANWGGTSAFLQLYDGTMGEDRTAIIRAMGRVIETAEQHPETSAQVLAIVTSKGLTQVEGSIKRLARQPIATEDEALRDAIGNYKAMRIMDTLTYPRTREIYQQLTTPPAPQTPQQ